MLHVLLAAGLSTVHLPLLGQTIRPICDSIGFCWNAEEMTGFISYLDGYGESAPSPPGSLVAAISVHDDYLYAGRVYHTLYRTLRAKEVVIFGVTHGSVGKALGSLSNVVILDEYDRWRGPYGDVEISPLRQLLRSRLPEGDVLVSNRAHDLEHSIEAVVPFLQHYNRDVKITPVMVTRMTFGRMEILASRMSHIISEYLAANRLELGKDVVILISNDANHYGPDFNNVPFGTDAQAHRRATENDRRIINGCLVGKVTGPRLEGLTKEIWPDSTRPRPIPVWCGRYPIVLGLLTTSALLRQSGREPAAGVLLRYSDTFTEKVLPVRDTSMGVTAVFSYQHWCGWFAQGFYSE
jgi:MEMO1 family protein